MKNNYYFPHVATFFFLLTVIVALVSWIGSIYGLGTVQSLLSPEGIRWELPIHSEPLSEVSREAEVTAIITNRL